MFRRNSESQVDFPAAGVTAAVLSPEGEDCDQPQPFQLPPSPADLRAEIARRRIHLYRLAAAVRLNPSALSRQLNEREPMSAIVATRLAAVIQRWEAGGDV